MVAPQTVSTIVSIVLVLTCGALAAVGPVTDLHIMNGDVEPDGYTRSAVLADGIFPGPLIRGYKVRLCYNCLRVHRDQFEPNQGDNFRINVIDHLINKTMLTSTTIVRCMFSNDRVLFHSVNFCRCTPQPALARNLSAWDELGRWSGICNTVPHHNRKLIPV